MPSHAHSGDARAAVDLAVAAERAQPRPSRHPARHSAPVNRVVRRLVEGNSKMIVSASRVLLLLTPRAAGLLIGCSLGVCSVGIWPLPNSVGYIPAIALRMIPLSIRPLTYTATDRGCG